MSTRPPSDSVEGVPFFHEDSGSVYVLRRFGYLALASSCAPPDEAKTEREVSRLKCVVEMATLTLLLRLAAFARLQLPVLPVCASMRSANILVHVAGEYSSS